MNISNIIHMVFFENKERQQETGWRGIEALFSSPSADWPLDETAKTLTRTTS